MGSKSWEVPMKIVCRETFEKSFRIGLIDKCADMGENKWVVCKELQADVIW